MIKFPHYVKTIDLLKYAKEKDFFVREIPESLTKVNEQAVERTIQSCIPKILKIKGDNEVGAFISPDGDLFHEYLGDKSSLSLSKTFLLPGDAVVHRHPISFKPFFRSIRTFSWADISAFILYDLYRSDVVDKSGGHYCIKKPPETPEFSKKRIKSALNCINEIKFSVTKMCKRDYFENDGDINNYMKNCWSSFANIFDLEYFHHEGQLSLIDRAKQAMCRLREQ